MSITAGTIALDDPTGDLLTLASPHLGRRFEIEPLQLGSKSQVFVLRGRDITLIAKHAATATIDVELDIYGRVLPGLGLAGPRPIDAARGGVTSWLLIEHIDGRTAVLDQPSDRRLLTDWVSNLETRWLAGSDGAGVPVRVLDDYLRRVLVLADGSWHRDGDAPAPAGASDDGHRRAEAERAAWQRLADAMPAVWRAASVLPVVLTHGDLSDENVFVTRGASGLPVVCPVDWERAALTPAAIDVCRLDEAAYRSAVTWASDLSPIELGAAQAAGHCLRLVMRDLAGMRSSKRDRHRRRLLRLVDALEDQGQQGGIG